ncbi:3-isopropylmalate/(R)-2-methylmalate dehydratase large subunit [Herbaspirillum sp. Sphag1AN]|uniref:3-isopropylmalate dehydratase large subunit n=1 Tax=unclassified Herbaspirillum TaxID=2624150 RepID=UPI0016108DCF|nr:MULTISPECIES: 3-isopropylmalate dehydratase large subunit [unclassified Herbaspirillum]MBB3211624.1 3-isopropylmalate/(R)-2-methylmalate dehydratase large subunit [Herbaspirillum sp. Sphag1AN]MBB3245108.1 3-isopropylmalate/(R)-2-methylmalate dehydratase large subunit [Herbaspirillum sp. Sphag64]
MKQIKHTNQTQQTMYRKIVASHTVFQIDGQHVALYADLHIMNEYTSPQAFAGLAEKHLPVRCPEKQMGVVDHVIPTHPVAHQQRTIMIDAAAHQAANFTRNCQRHGIHLFDVQDREQGIEHVVAPEIGLIRPGMVVLCGDSHTTTYGALGALGFGIGTSEVEHVLATQTLIYRLARDMHIQVDGQLPGGTTAKDLVLYIISKIGAQGARGYVVEYGGAAIASLSAEARMTLCNMTVEAGARGALIAPDQTTLDYVSARIKDMSPAAIATASEDWLALRSDADATYDARHCFDASVVAPFVTWGTSPDQAIAIDNKIPPLSTTALDAANATKALTYMGLEAGQAMTGLPIDHVFIGSCTNARIEDLRAVAAVVKGRRVAASVRAMVVPGSGRVREQAEREGIAQTLRDAGFEWRQPGCSMCLAMNDDILQPGQRCASTTNRNFEGRQGRGARTHLMSPVMAAAAALAGHLVDVRKEIEYV